SNTDGGSQKQVVESGSFGYLSATAGDGVIALAEPGTISLYDTKSGKTSDVPVTVRGDFAEVREKYVSLADGIMEADVSPNGKRAVFSSRGEIVTVPAKDGDGRNLTNSSGSAERSPAWSPDGKTIAYFSDASGEYKIVLQQSDGQGETKTLEPGGGNGFYQGLGWSPDSKKLSYSDMRGILWMTDVETGVSTKVDEAPYYPVTYRYAPSWSPDSKWMTFSRIEDNYLSAVFLYNTETKVLTQLTDGMSDATSPAFDRGGKYLYFLASTNVATSPGWLDLTALETPNTTSNAYVVLLRKDLPTPFAPKSDEEPITEPEKPGDAPPFSIDLDGIGRRILAAPMPTRGYVTLVAGPDGSFFTVDVPPSANAGSPPNGIPALRKFDIASQKDSVFAQGARGIAVSANGKFALISGMGGVSIVPTAAPPQPGQGTLDISSTMIKVDPRAEWRQMFHEVLRIERDYFYDPNYHGVDLNALGKKYEPFLDGLMSRADLNAVFIDMLGELCVGHMYISGGDIPGVRGPSVGFLGADFSQENGRYRFKKIFTGENWNPSVRAPLAQPGNEVNEGEYLLAVDGQDLKSTDNVYSRFEYTVGKQVRLRVGPNADGTGSREVTVVPTGSESTLRIYDWVEGNRRKVAELSGGRVGYVWLPNTSVAGYTFFNRYYYSQADKDGMVLDERFNGGGSVDDYFISMTSRPLMSWWKTRYGKPFTSPLMSVYGPKALLTNQYAGSGGDYFPWAFRRAKLGPLVGKRTWGGLVGILGFPPLVDGGGVTAPNLAFFSPEGKWEIENHGVDPDIDIEWDPVLWRQGRDAQLERAVAEVMKQLQNYHKPVPKIPPSKDNTKIGHGG
ncbi:MAG TPA: PDZ domain-containing protein, partial [Fimbriimonadaceae bacterium]|nr:PDZ domain-containing protein [Fimbriimonadaceae bacterium]